MDIHDIQSDRLPGEYVTIQEAGNQPPGQNLLWQHIQGHNGTKEILRLFLQGGIPEILSQSGVQQGGPLGSIHFALAIYPLLLEVGKKYPTMLITAYTDNVVMTGPLDTIKEAFQQYTLAMQTAGLTLKPRDSCTYIPSWRRLSPDNLGAQSGVRISEDKKYSTDVIWGMENSFLLNSQAAKF